MTAVAIVRAVIQETALSPRIKWPNDILLNHRKVAGILLESRVGSEQIEHAVIGFGINVNQTSADLPPKPRFEASSPRIELGKPVKRSALLAGIFGELEGLYEKVQQGDLATTLQLWRRLSTTLARPIRVWQQEKVIEGIAMDIIEEGGLLVRAKDESPKVIHAGDVEYLPLAMEVEDGV